MSAREALLLSAIVSLVSLQSLHVSESLSAPLALVQILVSQISMLGFLVQFQRGLVLADEGTGAALEGSLAFAGQSLVTL